MLERLADASVRCKQYAEDAYLAMDHGPGPLRNAEAGLINLIAGTHNEIRSEVVDYFGSVRSFAITQGENVSESIELYESTDEELAATLDQTLWSIDVHAIQAELREFGRSSDLDLDRPEAKHLEREDPEAALIPLTDYRAEMPFVPDWAEDPTLVGRARDTIWQVTHVAAELGLLSRPYDVIAELVIPFTGDWAGLRACGDALEHLTVATGRVKANNGWIARRIDAVWLGIAADGCLLQTYQLGECLHDAAPALEKYAKAYHNVVDEVQELERKASEVAVELLDWAVVVVAAMANPGGGVATFLKKLWDLLPPTGLVQVVIRVLHLLDLVSLAVRAMWDFEAQAELGMLHGPGVSASMPAVPSSSTVTYQ
jgi:hypothetical protein